jgi:hypothetical protein
MGTNFSGIRTPGISKILALFLPLLLLTAVGACRAQNPATSSDQKADKADKVDKEFYTPKDRLAAIEDGEAGDERCRLPGMPSDIG